MAKEHNLPEEPEEMQGYNGLAKFDYCEECKFDSDNIEKNTVCVICASGQGNGFEPKDK